MGAIERGVVALGNAHAACLRAIEDGYTRHPDGERLLGWSVVQPEPGERPVDTTARLVCALTRKEEAAQNLQRQGHWAYSGLHHQCVRAALRGELRELNRQLTELIGE